MKKILLIILAVLVSHHVFGQYKVVNESTKKTPDWVYSLEKDYLIVTGIGPDLEEVKGSLLAGIKQQISESIASRIVAESTFSSVDTQINDESDYRQKMETSINSKTAKLPFIGEISLSKVADFYWEERYYKKNKKTEFFCALKYPFSEFEMKKLVMEYKEHDHKLNIKLAEFEAGLDNITSIEDIDKAIIDLKAFLDEFLNDDPRYSKVTSISNQYRRLYDYITINASQQKKGVIVASLLLSDKEISTRQKPRLKSNCATKLSPSFEGNTLVVKYDDFGCYDQEENYIEIKFKTGNKYLSETVYFKSVVSISLNGIVKDQISGEPIPYARLTLIPSGKVATSARNGLYQFNDLGSGDYSVQATKSNYASEELNTRVVAGSTARCDFMLTPTGDKNESAPMPSGTPTAPVAQVAQVAVATPSPGINPANTVRNGLFGYYRFNGNANDELGGINGQLINKPTFVNDGKDNTQALALNAANESFISFPKEMIKDPAENYAVTFWAKGLSDGHIFTSTTGSKYQSDNVPRLIMTNGKLKLINKFDNISPFSHGEITYQWHFIAVVVQTLDRRTTLSLYIDGELIDIIEYNGTYDVHPTKFIFGGSHLDLAAVSMTIDNLRIYNARGISAKEVKQIYDAEK